jgi:hypothetical protein
VQHRSEENEILATNQRDLDVCSLGECSIELLCRIQTGKSASGYDYSGLLTWIHSSRLEDFLTLGEFAWVFAAKFANVRAILAVGSYREAHCGLFEAYFPNRKAQISGNLVSRETVAARRSRAATFAAFSNERRVFFTNTAAEDIAA